MKLSLQSTLSFLLVLLCIVHTVRSSFILEWFKSSEELGEPRDQEEREIYNKAFKKEYDDLLKKGVHKCCTVSLPNRYTSGVPIVENPDGHTFCQGAAKTMARQAVLQHRAQKNSN